MHFHSHLDSIFPGAADAAPTYQVISSHISFDSIGRGPVVRCLLIGSPLSVAFIIEGGFSARFEKSLGIPAVVFFRATTTQHEDFELEDD